jgi:DnaD/phage-associated family protein
VARFLGASGQELERALDAKVSAAVQRGTLLKMGEGAAARLYLNTAENRRALANTGKATEDLDDPSFRETWPSPDAGPPSGTAFSAYEENIGLLTPVAIRRLEEALLDYAEEDVVEAIGAAVDANARNWNYISAVLRARSRTRHRPPAGTGRADPGRIHDAQRGNDGKPGRYSPQGLSDEFIREYVERQRRRGQQRPGPDAGR